MIKAITLILIFSFTAVIAAADEANSDVKGMATMLDDGTIFIYPFQEENVLADGQIIIKPEDNNYLRMLIHLGGLEIGEEKPIYSWPDEK
jgi:hypothetical protein